MEQPPLPHLKGNIIMLVGGSSSGKSSVIKKIIELAPQFEERGQDIAYKEVIHRRLKAAAPEVYNYLREALKEDPSNWIIPNAVWGEGFNFNDPTHYKPGITKHHMLNVQIECTKLKLKLKKSCEPNEDVRFLLDTILNDCKEGKHIVVDFLYIGYLSDHPLIVNHSVPTKIGIVYCPFNELATRVENRNQSANFEEKRKDFIAYHHYSKIFKRKTLEGEPSIDSINRHDCTQAFYKLYKGAAYLRDKKLKVFLKAFGFNPDDPSDTLIEVTPRYNQVIQNLIKCNRIPLPDILSSGKNGLTPEEIAKKLLS